MILSIHGLRYHVDLVSFRSSEADNPAQAHALLCSPSGIETGDDCCLIFLHQLGQQIEETIIRESQSRDGIRQAPASVPCVSLGANTGHQGLSGFARTRLRRCTPISEAAGNLLEISPTAGKASPDATPSRSFILKPTALFTVDWQGTQLQQSAARS